MMQWKAFCCLPRAVSQKALDFLLELAQKAEDSSMRASLEAYSRHPSKMRAGKLASEMHRSRHRNFVDLIMDMLREEGEQYPSRKYDIRTEERVEKLKEKAQQEVEIVRNKGFKAEYYFEEPFLNTYDDMELKAYVLSYKMGFINRKSYVKEVYLND